jgi:hypothetical protein
MAFCNFADFAHGLLICYFAQLLYSNERAKLISV